MLDGDAYYDLWFHLGARTGRTTRAYIEGLEPAQGMACLHESGRGTATGDLHHVGEAAIADDLAALVQQWTDLARQAAVDREALAAPVAPGQERACEAATVLDRADELAALAATEQNNRLLAYEAMRHAQEVGRQLEEAKNKSRLALRLAGTSRKETIALAAEYAQKERTAYHEILRAARACEDAVRQAWSTACGSDAVDRLEEPGGRRADPARRDARTPSRGRADH